jgi:hypothetical protein
MFGGRQAWGAGCTFPSPESFQKERTDLSFRSCWQPRLGFQPSPEQIKAKGRDLVYGTGGGSGRVGKGVSAFFILSCTSGQFSPLGPTQVTT